VIWIFPQTYKGLSWSWSYGGWIYSYLCNQCLSSLTLWVWIQLRWGVLDTTLCDKVCLWLAAGWWFSLGSPISSTNETDRHDMTEILLKVALSTITITLSWLDDINFFWNIHMMRCFVCYRLTEWIKLEKKDGSMLWGLLALMIVM
jgi:hypothetical protein